MSEEHPLTRNEIALIREVIASELSGRDRLFEERDKRYAQGSVADKEAVKAALAAAEKAAEKTEAGLKEYKQVSNEWRSTVQDLVSRLQGQGQGIQLTGGLIVGALASLAALVAIVSGVVYMIARHT